MRRVLLAILALAIVAGIGVGLLVGSPSFRQNASAALAERLDVRASDDARPTRFSVRSGESTASIAARLEGARLVDSALGFRLLARLRGADGQLQAGEYVLRANMTSGEIIAALSGGGNAGGFTIPEGWRAAEIADLLDRRGLLQRDEFLGLVREGTFENDFLQGRPAGASLEGYLFPDTYQFLPGTPAREVVQAMLDDFGRRLTPELRAKARARGLSLHEILTLASIVEREAVLPEERPIIAGVFYNRIEKDMLIQADATVQFAVAGPNPASITGGYWKRGLTQLDLGAESPYNTYRQRGLPPGPICSPGLDAIRAAIEPETTDYLYFVAKSDGSHVFARTLKEHNENVARYLSAE